MNLFGKNTLNLNIFLHVYLEHEEENCWSSPIPQDSLRGNKPRNINFFDSPVTDFVHMFSSDVIVKNKRLLYIFHVCTVNQ